MESGFSDLARRGRRIVATAATVLFPHSCVRCGKEGSVVCEKCKIGIHASLRGIFRCPVCNAASVMGTLCESHSVSGSMLDSHIAMGSYADPVLRNLMHQYKYEGVEEAGAVLNELFGYFLDRHMNILHTHADVRVATVPLHWFRKAMRGFNQSQPFAEKVAGSLSVTVCESVLRRKFSRHSQVSLDDHADRDRNVRGCMTVGHEVSGDWLLVDDVYTTGATMRECAEVLRRAGAASVHGITLLRG